MEITGNAGESFTVGGRALTAVCRNCTRIARHQNLELAEPTED